MARISRKQRAFEILEWTDKEDTLSRCVAIVIMTLIAVSVLSVILETEQSLMRHYHSVFKALETVALLIFSVEYVTRVWSCTSQDAFRHPIWGRIRYISTPMLAMDLFAILPFYMPLVLSLDLRFLRILRLFRIFRIFKLARYSSALRALGNVYLRKKEDLGICAFALGVLLVLFSCIMYACENKAQPDKFPSILESMWWTVITMTTVGYGDVYPVTTLGKIAASAIAVLGIGLFALPAGILASGFIEEAQKPKPSCCPHCGKPIE